MVNQNSSLSPLDDFLRVSIHQLRTRVRRIEVCLDQLTDDQIWARRHEVENAVGNLVIHLCGNIRQWIVGGIGGILIGQIIILIEKTFFSSSSLNLLEFSTRGKILILIWVVFSTIGIWRSAENYNGPSFLKIITKIYVAVNCFSSIYILFFFNTQQVLYS